MALRGDLPKNLATCDLPKCPGCLYGKACKRPWRTSLQDTHIRPLIDITRPGQCISVDQLESPTPGFIAQLKGKPTLHRYRAATIFVDHYSRLGFVHLQESTTAEETLQAKHAFERYSRSHGVHIEHYHADNGRFAELVWLADVAREGQTVSFSAVNAHFQNGVAEKRIRDIQDMARSELLYAKLRWPVAISVNLWPYAVRSAQDALNSTPLRHDGISPLETFTHTQVKPRITDFHHFGIPVYVLKSELASGKKINKWLPRAHLGIYLGMSPRHARSVALVLNPETGLVSPQFHLKFDDTWETVRGSTDKDLGKWRHKAGLHRIQSNQITFTRPKTPVIPPTPPLPGTSNLPGHPNISHNPVRTPGNEGADAPQEDIAHHDYVHDDFGDDDPFIEAAPIHAATAPPL
jgi:hypothetical protein